MKNTDIEEGVLESKKLKLDDKVHSKSFLNSPYASLLSTTSNKIYSTSFSHKKYYRSQPTSPKKHDTREKIEFSRLNYITDEQKRVRKFLASDLQFHSKTFSGKLPQIK